MILSPASFICLFPILQWSLMPSKSGYHMLVEEFGRPQRLDCEMVRNIDKNRAY